MAEKNDNQAMLLVGCGHMGTALLQGWLKKWSGDIFVIAPRPKAFLQKLHDEQKIILNPAASQFANKKADLVVYAVKPHILQEAITQTVNFLGVETLVISVAAGINVLTIQKFLLKEAFIIRVMPNTPSAALMGMAICYSADNLADRQKEAINILFGCVGKTVWLPKEELMHAATALSGSGPAYFYLLTEMMTKAGQALGLPVDLAQDLAVQTFMGAAELLKKEKQTAIQLRQNITSPNGTTNAAISHFMQPSDGLYELVLEAMKKASLRSKEISESL